MPTHEENERFDREYLKLSPEQKLAFKRSVAMFVADLGAGSLRPSLRVKRFRRIPGAFELTWARDGRALWRYGSGPNPNDVHIEWLRIGTHEIFNDD
jgi:hypothetical protein